MTTTTDNNAPVRGFIHSSRAWYRESLSGGPVIMLGLYHPNGGTSGEFAFRWHELSARGRSPRLEVFDDAWRVLPQFDDVLQALAAFRPVETKGSWWTVRSPVTEDDVRELLLRCGLADLTAYTQGTDR